MNMSSPDLELLRSLITEVDDEVDDHVLWVARDGTVHLSPWDSHPKFGPESDVAYRFSPFKRCGGHVGPSASDKWVREVYDTLCKKWVLRADWTKGDTVLMPDFS